MRVDWTKFNALIQVSIELNDSISKESFESQSNQRNEELLNNKKTANQTQLSNRNLHQLFFKVITFNMIVTQTSL